MESQMWRSHQMKSHEYDHHRRFHSSDQQSHQVDLTLRLGFPNANVNNNGEALAADIDHNKPALHHNINHHVLQPHQVMVTNHGLASSGELMSEANYNPHQIVWSKEMKTYVLKSSSNLGQLHNNQSNSFNNINSNHQVRGTGNTANNLANLPLQKNNNNDLYTLLNPASRTTADNDPEAEASSAARRKGSRRRRVSTGIEPEKRCTNYNCNTNFTPMWRKGPLGPKSLCNACGIRYRKETLNKEAMAGENSQS